MLNERAQAAREKEQEDEEKKRADALDSVTAFDAITEE